jgi:hypothetical protein
MTSSDPITPRGQIQRPSFGRVWIGEKTTPATKPSILFGALRRICATNQQLAANSPEATLLPRPAVAALWDLDLW